MLDRADMSPAIGIAELDKAQAFVEILRAGFLVGSDIREELHAEFHGFLHTLVQD